MTEYADRYEALGISYPDPETMCKGQCDGVGVYPQKSDDPSITDKEKAAWDECHANTHTLGAALRELRNYREFWFWKSIVRDVLNGSWFKCDGWHFIKCPDCNGTGKR